MLKINEIEVGLTKRVLGHARGDTTRDIAEDNIKARANSTQLKNQGQVILMEGSLTLKNIEHFINVGTFLAVGVRSNRKAEVVYSSFFDTDSLSFAGISVFNLIA